MFFKLCVTKHKLYINGTNQWCEHTNIYYLVDKNCGTIDGDTQQ